MEGDEGVIPFPTHSSATGPQVSKESFGIQSLTLREVIDKRLLIVLIGSRFELCAILLHEFLERHTVSGGRDDALYAG